MLTRPTPAQAMARLRLDADLIADLPDAIEQAHAATVTFLDGALYDDANTLHTAQDPRGIVCTPDIIAAQLLLVDALVGNNSLQDRQDKRTAAINMLRPHRNAGT